MNKETENIIIYTDGSCQPNPGEMGIGLIIIKGSTKIGEDNIIIKSDSRLLVNQLIGRYKVKNPGIRKYYREVTEIIEENDLEVKFEWTTRELNQEADALAKRKGAPEEL